MTSQVTKPNAPNQAFPSDRDAHLPHDRDEQAGDATGSQSGDAQHGQNRQPIEQAHADVEAGLQDTEARGTPNQVPSSRENR